MINLFTAKKGKKTAFLKTKVTTELRRFQVSSSVFWSNLLQKTGINTESKYSHLAISRRYDDALTLYEPVKYNGPLHLFVADKRFAGFPDPQWGWGGVINDRIIINELPVYPHGTLVEPYVQLLSEKLNHELAKVYNTGNINSENITAKKVESIVN